MHTRVAHDGAGATTPTPVVGSEFGNTPASGSDPEEWFYPAALALLGNKDTGQLLHYESGYPLSSCYAYTTDNAAKRRAIPDHLVRRLIHSERGEPWFNAYMHGCKAKWWIKRERERHLADLARSIFEQLGSALKQ